MTDADVAEVYRATFAPRYDAYADWDAAEGHWVAVRGALTIERVLEGLQTKHPVSAYMEDREGATHVGAIDFDSAEGWDTGVAVASELVAAGAFPMLERSRRGAHLWLVLDRVIPGSTVRLGLRAFVAKARPGAERNPRVEILPKHLTTRGPATVGSPLRMPMMSHPATGERHPLCDAHGDPLGTRVSEVLTNVTATSALILIAAAASVKLPVSEIRVPDYWRRPAQPAGDVVGLLLGAGVERAAPGRSVRCPLHDDQVASLAISRDGERVWCKSPACEANNGDRGLGADQLAKALGGSHD